MADSNLDQILSDHNQKSVSGQDFFNAIVATNPKFKDYPPREVVRQFFRSNPAYFQEFKTNGRTVNFPKEAAAPTGPPTAPATNGTAKKPQSLQERITPVTKALFSAAYSLPYAGVDKALPPGVKEFRQGVGEGMGELAASFTNPMQAALLATAFLKTPKALAKFPRLYRAVSTALRRGRFTADTIFSAEFLGEAASDIPGAKEAYDKGDYRTAGNLAFRALSDIGLGVTAATGAVKNFGAGKGAPKVETPKEPPPEARAEAPKPKEEPKPAFKPTPSRSEVIDQNRDLLNKLRIEEEQKLYTLGPPDPAALEKATKARIAQEQHLKNLESHYAEATGRARKPAAPPTPPPTPSAQPAKPTPKPEQPGETPAAAAPPPATAPAQPGAAAAPTPGPPPTPETPPAAAQPPVVPPAAAQPTAEAAPPAQPQPAPQAAPPAAQAPAPTPEAAAPKAKAPRAKKAAKPREAPPPTPAAAAPPTSAPAEAPMNADIQRQLEEARAENARLKASQEGFTEPPTVRSEAPAEQATPAEGVSDRQKALRDLLQKAKTTGVTPELQKQIRELNPRRASQRGSFRLSGGEIGKTPESAPEQPKVELFGGDPNNPGLKRLNELEATMSNRPLTPAEEQEFHRLLVDGFEAAKRQAAAAPPVRSAPPATRAELKAQDEIARLRFENQQLKEGGPVEYPPAPQYKKGGPKYYQRRLPGAENLPPTPKAPPEFAPAFTVSERIDELNEKQKNSPYGLSPQEENELFSLEKRAAKGRGEKLLTKRQPKPTEAPKPDKYGKPEREEKPPKPEKPATEQYLEDIKSEAEGEPLGEADVRAMFRVKPEFRDRYRELYLKQRQSRTLPPMGERTAKRAAALSLKLPGSNLTPKEAREMRLIETESGMKIPTEVGVKNARAAILTAMRTGEDRVKIEVIDPLSNNAVLHEMTVNPQQMGPGIQQELVEAISDAGPGMQIRIGNRIIPITERTQAPARERAPEPAPEKPKKGTPLSGKALEAAGEKLATRFQPPTPAEAPPETRAEGTRAERRKGKTIAARPPKEEPPAVAARAERPYEAARRAEEVLKLDETRLQGILDSETEAKPLDRKYKLTVTRDLKATQKKLKAAIKETDRLRPEEEERIKEEQKKLEKIIEDFYQRHPEKMRREPRPTAISEMEPPPETREEMRMSA